MSARHLASLVLLVAACAPANAPPDAGESPADGGQPERDAGPPPAPRCVDGAPAFPDGTFEDVPDFALPGLDVDGNETTIRIRDLYDPCAERSSLVMLRFVAPWCASCLWDLEHTDELFIPELAGRLRVIDMVASDDQNGEPTLAAARQLRSRNNRPDLTALAPLDLVAAMNTTRQPLTFVVLLDSRTLQRIYRSGSPAPERLVGRMKLARAVFDGEEPPEPWEPVLVDEHWSRREWDLIRAMRLPDAPPPDPTNRWADDPDARALGARLFSDTGLSPSNAVSCATCHDATKHFADGRPTSPGAGPGSRNSPSVTLAAHARWQFWDGRADTLWAQALGPFENDAEFASTRTFVARRAVTAHANAWEDTFGTPPDLSDTTRFPDDAKPGNASWEAMPEPDRALVTETFVKAGKAIAAFERSLRVRNNRLDAYAAGDMDALTEVEKHGLEAFFATGCAQCHHGPMLDNGAFHNLRFPTGRPDGLPDRGRIDALALFAGAEFRGDGTWSDAPVSRAIPEATPRLLGAFKTPPLRGIVHTAPYGHGGNIGSIADLVGHYSTAGLPPDDARAVGRVEPWVPQFTQSHRADLEAFLNVLEALPAD